MFFIVSGGIFFLLLCWLLLSRLIISLDTRIPLAEVRWAGIGSVRLLFAEEKWLLKIHVLFFTKVVNLSRLVPSKASAEKKKANKKAIKPKDPVKLARAMMRVIKSFSISRWHISLDTGDYAYNARLFAVYALPAARDHVHINFQDKNYLLLQVRNTPLRMFLAYVNIHFF